MSAFLALDIITCEQHIRSPHFIFLAAFCNNKETDRQPLCFSSIRDESFLVLERMSIASLWSFSFLSFTLHTLHIHFFSLLFAWARNQFIVVFPCFLSVTIRWINDCHFLLLSFSKLLLVNVSNTPSIFAQRLINLSDYFRYFDSVSPIYTRIIFALMGSFLVHELPIQNGTFRLPFLEKLRI